MRIIIGNIIFISTMKKERGCTHMKKLSDFFLVLSGFAFTTTAVSVIIAVAIYVVSYVEAARIESSWLQRFRLWSGVIADPWALWTDLSYPLMIIFVVGMVMTALGILLAGSPEKEEEETDTFTKHAREFEEMDKRNRKRMKEQTEAFEEMRKNSERRMNELRDKVIGMMNRALGGGVSPITRTVLMDTKEEEGK